MKPVITLEQAQKAAAKVREYMNNGEDCRGPQWTHPTFNLAYILQEWRNPNIFDTSTWNNDFAEEYEFISEASSYNWHHYEDIE